MLSHHRDLTPTRLRRWKLLGGLCVAAWLGACQSKSTAQPPQILRDIPFVSQTGQNLDLGELADRVVLLNFMFTSCPVVCPRETRSLVEVREALPAEARARVRFVSVSVDPDNDDPSALLRFARAQNADVPGWSFVRSNSAATQRLMTALAAFDPSAPPSPSAHTTGLYLFDRLGRLVQRYQGSPIEVPRLARELAALADQKPSEARLASN